jgi:hypothetical protein
MQLWNQGAKMVQQRIDFINLFPHKNCLVIIYAGDKTCAQKPTENIFLVLRKCRKKPITRKEKQKL